MSGFLFCLNRLLLLDKCNLNDMIAEVERRSRTLWRPAEVSAETGPADLGNGLAVSTVEVMQCENR